MSKLGEITAITITTPDLQRSLAFYKLLGYNEVMRADWPFSWIQVCDGGVLIMLRKDPEPYIALTYYVRNINKVVKGLEKEGIKFTQKPGKDDSIMRYLLRSPDGLTISLVGLVEGFSLPAVKTMLQMQQEDYYDPEKYPNKKCGIYGELAHPVKDLQRSISFWKILGFEVKSEFSSPYPWAIMTDGLSTMGLHQSRHFDYPAITYFAADMNEKIEYLRKKGLKDYTMQGAGNAVLRTPEGQHILLYKLGEQQEHKPSIEGISQAVIGTARLWLKELSPEIMERVFTTFPDKDIKLFLGLANDKELETEKNNFRQGLTSYRASFKNFLLVEKETERVIGRAGFHTWAIQHARAELGYAISNDADKDKGYMKEALAAIVHHGFDRMQLNRIEALVGPTNVPSLKLMEGLGFTKEGVMRSHYCKNGETQDSVCFSLLKSEYSGT